MRRFQQGSVKGPHKGQKGFFYEGSITGSVEEPQKRSMRVLVRMHCGLGLRVGLAEPQIVRSHGQKVSLAAFGFVLGP